jgi:predicted heme/steroid binding protein/uncharacterized membrane protein
MVKEFDEDTLAKSNGSEGSPVYISYKGRVIDVSKSNLWKTGVHMNLHHAGNDLTANIQAAPHDTTVLEKFPQVGVLKEKKIEGNDTRKLVSEALDRFPFLKRHPHPMFVHFPIAFSFSTPMFIFLYLATGIKSFETTALHCLGGAIMFTPLGMLTGWFTWWFNYLAKPLKPVVIKIICSFILMIFLAVAFIWRIAIPDIVTTVRGATIVYLLLVTSFIPIIAIIGWFGAALTFPIEKK